MSAERDLAEAEMLAMGAALNEWVASIPSVDRAFADAVASRMVDEARKCAVQLGRGAKWTSLAVPEMRQGGTAVCAHLAEKGHLAEVSHAKGEFRPVWPS